MLTASHYGLRKKYLIDICEQITNSRDNREFCAGIFIDLPKAFDTIDHTIFLKNWNTVGFVVLHLIGLKVIQQSSVCFA